MAADVPALIENAIKQAADAAVKAVTYAESAQDAANVGIGFNPLPGVVPETFVVPAFTPNKDLSAAFKTDFDVVWHDMEAWVRGLMLDYVNTYFPVLDPAIQTAENVWLLGIVNNGYLGIPVAVETAMWDRARAKDTLEALRMEDEAVTQMSARGFSLPPGVLANRLQVIQQEATNKSSTIARDLAIKQTEISIEMTKFAIGEMSKLRLGIAAALADFMRAWMTLPTAAAEVAKAKTEMNKVLWDSSANYIHALVAKAGLKVDADKASLSARVQEDSVFSQASLGILREKVAAASSAATQMGSIAASYASTLNTLSHIGDVTTHAG